MSRTLNDTAEAQTVRAIFAALNRNDIPAAAKAFDAEIEWIEPAEYGGGGPCRGREAVVAHLARAREKWAEGSCEIEQIFVAGDAIIAFVHVRVRLTLETDWRTGRHAGVYTFRNGEVVRMYIFDDRWQALKWAGIPASDANESDS